MIKPWYTAITLSTMFTWRVNLQTAYRTIELLASNIVLLFCRRISKCESYRNNKKYRCYNQHDYDVKISVLVYVNNKNTNCTDRNREEEF